MEGNVRTTSYVDFYSTDVVTLNVDYHRFNLNMGAGITAPT